MKFTKMQCAGNDFLVLNCFDKRPETPGETAAALCDRHYGVGADAVVLIMKSENADFKIRVFNPDESEAACSASAIAVAVRYMLNNKLADKTEFAIETLSGIYTANADDDKVLVNMGEPVFTPQLVPVDYTGDEFIDKIINVNGEEYAVTCLFVGNPHAVLYPNDIYEMDVEALGKGIEMHQIFPNRINAEFVNVIDDETLDIRVWSRGTGEVFSSGSGACAAVVASNINNKCGRIVKVRHIGGEFLIKWNDEDNCVYLTVSPETAFTGEIDLD